MINNLLILNYQSITDVLMFVNILQKSLSHLYLNSYFLKILLRFPIPVPVPAPVSVPAPVPAPAPVSRPRFPFKFQSTPSRLQVCFCVGCIHRLWLSS